jgi:hypothetical protein
MSIISEVFSLFLSEGWEQRVQALEIGKGAESGKHGCQKIRTLIRKTRIRSDNSNGFRSTGQPMNVDLRSKP